MGISVPCCHEDVAFIASPVGSHQVEVVKSRLGERLRPSEVGLHRGKEVGHCCPCRACVQSLLSRRSTLQLVDSVKEILTHHGIVSCARRQTRVSSPGLVGNGVGGT